jgi:ammonium transporter family
MNQADTAWMLVSTALVLLMTPALAFFYGGLVRSKNALNTMMMSFISLGFVAVAWAAIGYSLAFSEGSNFLGDTSNALLHRVGLDAKGTIPHLLFMCYQGTFCIITAALISGAIVEPSGDAGRLGAARHHAAAENDGGWRRDGDRRGPAMDVSMHGEDAYVHTGGMGSPEALA